MKIIVHASPRVDPKFKGELFNTLTRLYNDIQPTRAGIVDVYLFVNTHDMRLFIEREAQNSGVENAYSDVEFTSYHWAWSGWPCIAVCSDVSRYKDKSIWDCPNFPFAQG